MHDLLISECYTIHRNQFLLHNVESYFYEVILYEKNKDAHFFSLSEKSLWNVGNYEKAISKQ